RAISPLPWPSRVCKKQPQSEMQTIKPQGKSLRLFLFRYVSARLRGAAFRFKKIYFLCLYITTFLPFFQFLKLPARFGIRYGGR
ncbi:MAG: hypothetical protein IKV55_00080, partial [Oscillospiraceae bacterium]|nr:hypothetical protein [Oscillospiraceae bacterium]